MQLGLAENIVCLQPKCLFEDWLHLFSQDWPLIVHCVEISVNTVWEYITQVDTLEYITQVDTLGYMTQVNTLRYITQVDTLGYMTQVDKIDYITIHRYEHTSNNSLLHCITRFNMRQVKINCIKIFDYIGKPVFSKMDEFSEEEKFRREGGKGGGSFPI